jgi:mannose-1-phosphate guanylyltransferase
MLWALVMAGGRGTRLWPLTDERTPKPLLELLPGKKSLLKETLKRINAIIPPSRVLIVANQEHLSQIRRHAGRVPKQQIIGEPCSRNTAPTIGFAASLIFKRDPAATLLVLPADHWIEPEDKFHQAVKEAAKLSIKSSQFVIFGARPTHPSASYGYLAPGKKVNRLCYQLKGFVEKPDRARAQKLLKAGCLWHAGIFLAPVRTILDSLEKKSPAISKYLGKLTVKAGKILPEKVFRAFPDISIDYAVLEKLKNAFLVKGEFEWCDVGTWKSFEDFWTKDKAGNAVLGSCFPFEAGSNVVYSKNKPVCLVGVKDLVVINTPKALLITKKDTVEQVRKVAINFKKNKTGK